MEGAEGVGEGFPAMGVSLWVCENGKRGGGVHFVGEDIATWAAHGVVRRDLHHDLVQILNDILELLYTTLSIRHYNQSHPAEKSYAQGECALRDRGEPL